MRLATVRTGGHRRWGAVEGERLRLAPVDNRTPPGLLEYIRSNEALPDTASWEPLSLAGVELTAPLPDPPRNVMCLGLNYADHAAESQGTTPDAAELPTNPIVFTKATTSVAGPHARIETDTRVTRRLDWEVELGVVIGRGGRFIPAASAMDHVFGYCVINDLSARERQKHHKQFFIAKSMDGSCPMGPWITTADEVPDPHELTLTTRVNGKLKQSSSTRHMIFRIPEIIETLSTVMTLVPGDIIATGTPAGVGFARNPPEYLQHGDRVECEIEGLGRLANEIVVPGR